MDSPFEVRELDAGRTVTCLPELIRFLRRESPDVLLSAHYFANVVSTLAVTLARNDATLVLTERLNISQVLSGSESAKDRLLPYLMRWTYPRADARVAVSEDAAADLASFLGMDEDEVTAIYNPTLTDEVFKRSEESIDHPWFEDDVPVVLGAGRLTGQKDFGTLIQAFHELLDDRGARLLILGEGEDRSKLEDLVKRLDVRESVDLHGYVDNPYKFMRAADVFVLSSRYEGMPNVLVEAAALGTPLVATDCPSGPRELLDGRAAGELVPVGDSDSMAEAIRRQLSDPERARSDLDTIQDTLEQFRPEVACDNYLELIREVRDE
jgi:glycosyltransferase involved in cell wall biosynthesis